MIDKKPWTIKVIIGLFITKLIFIALIIITFGIVKDIDSDTRTGGAGIKDALVSSFNLDMSNSAYAFGTLIGTNLIPALVAILGIIFILNRKFIPSLIILIIDLLIGLGMMNPFIAITNIILFLLKSSKNYMKGIDESVKKD
jgi:hypothetical protein